MSQPSSRPSVCGCAEKLRMMVSSAGPEIGTRYAVLDAAGENFPRDAAGDCSSPGASAMEMLVRQLRILACDGRFVFRRARGTNRRSARGDLRLGRVSITRFIHACHRRVGMIRGFAQGADER